MFYFELIISPSNSFRENRARSPAQSNKVPPPDGILFIGDSMIRNFDADNVSFISAQNLKSIFR